MFEYGEIESIIENQLQHMKKNSDGVTDTILNIFATNLKYKLIMARDQKINDNAEHHMTEKELMQETDLRR